MEHRDIDVISLSLRKEKGAARPHFLFNKGYSYKAQPFMLRPAQHRLKPTNLSGNLLLKKGCSFGFTLQIRD